ncbi:MAG: SOS response-associated peptidase [Mesorhizobium sp.]|nr:MAG: SOS response-associated peptidase [Mesorhizobium sp.]
MRDHGFQLLLDDGLCHRHSRRQRASQRAALQAQSVAQAAKRPHALITRPRPPLGRARRYFLASPSGYPPCSRMCNRFRSIHEWSETPRKLARSLINFEFNPNVAPTESVPAFLGSADKPAEARLARFGIALPPKQGRKPHNLLNVRIESLRQGSFRSLLAGQRCIVPAQGFYEWREEAGGKQPYYFYRKDGEPISFACVWDYSDVKGERVPSFAILTDAASPSIAPYHDRMPVVIDNPEQWLAPLENPLDALHPLADGELAIRPVNRALNRVAEKNLAAIEAPPQASLF